MAKYNSLQQCTFEQINLFPSAPIQFLNHCYSKICTFYRKYILQRKYLESRTSYILLITAYPRKPLVSFEFMCVRQNCLQSQNILNFFLLIATSKIYFLVGLMLQYIIYSDLISFLFSKKTCSLGHPSVYVFTVFRFTLNSLNAWFWLLSMSVDICQNIWCKKEHFFNVLFVFICFGIVNILQIFFL